MGTIERLSDEQLHDLLKRLAKESEPREAANAIVFYLSGYELEEADGITLELSTPDERVATDIRFAAEVARDIVCGYECVQIEGTEPHEDGRTTIRLSP